MANSSKPISCLLIKLRIRTQIHASPWKTSSPKWIFSKITLRPRVPQLTANLNSVVSTTRRWRRETISNLDKRTLLMLLHQFRSNNKTQRRKWEKIRLRYRMSKIKSRRCHNLMSKSRRRLILIWERKTPVRTINPKRRNHNNNRRAHFSKRQRSSWRHLYNRPKRGKW